jgi:hypothetical protein
VFGKQAVLTMPEVQVVYNYNSGSINRLLSSTSSTTATASTATEEVQAQVEGMLQKTMDLLDKKAQLLQEGRRSLSAGQTEGPHQGKDAVDALQLMLLRGDWLVKWAACLPVSENGTRTQHSISALQLYEQCSAGAVHAAQTAQSSTAAAKVAALQGQLCTSFTRHCDSLLHRMEQDTGTGAAGEGGALAEQLVASGVVPRQTQAGDGRAAAAALTVRCFVQGLQMGNDYCMQRVLRLVQIIGAYPAQTEHILRSQLSSLPPWVFLQFAAQLMGCLDRPEGVVISSLLEHTAAAYPGALYYPFRITSEFLGVQGRERSAKLAVMLRDPAQDAFIEALGGLTHPEHRWNDGMKEMDAILRSAGTAALDEVSKQRAAAAYQRVRRVTLETEWGHVGGQIGSYNRLWARNAKPIADKLAGPAGEKLVSGGRKALEALREGINSAKFSAEMPFAGGRAPLAEFSQWLSDFDPVKCKIEMPGLYSRVGGARSGSSVLYGGPRTMASAGQETVIGVDPSLLVMSSIRKPKRVLLFGSTGTQRLFLVKGGEDLRNDERIQQLFGLMNSVVGTATQDSNDGGAGASSTAGLRARTYAVIPMTSQVLDPWSRVANCTITLTCERNLINCRWVCWSGLVTRPR